VMAERALLKSSILKVWKNSQMLPHEMMYGKVSYTALLF